MAKKKPKWVVIYLSFKVFSFFIYILPFRLAIKAGGLLGKSAYFILRRLVKTALRNLDIAYASTKSTEEKQLIVKKVFENLGKDLIEIICLSKFAKYNIDRYISCEGLDVIQDLMKSKKGGIVLSAHLGNWEFMAHYFAIKGYLVNVIARRMRIEQFERFLDKIRTRHGVNILYRDTSTKEVIALLRKNEFVGIMPDQDMDSVSGVFCDFFGEKAYTPSGAAVLNLLTGLPIIPCFIVRGDFGHKIVIERPLALVNTGERDKDILENTQRYTRKIEEYIRRYPEQWVWFHERWKTRPQQTQMTTDQNIQRTTGNKRVCTHL